MSEWKMEWKSDLIYDPMQILLKNVIICGNISLASLVSTFLRQFYPGDLVNFAGSTKNFFFIAAAII